jgi:hypothetical protein
MSVNAKHIVPVAVVISLVVALAGLVGPSRHALAAGSRGVTLSDLGDFSGAEGGANNSIAGAKYAQGILFAFDKSYVTLYTGKFPGYAAFTAAVGVPDGSTDDHAGTVTVIVTVDGKKVKSITKSNGQAATMLTVPFGHASQIKLTVHENQKKTLYVLLGNPTVVASLPKAVATPEPIGNGGGNSNGGGSGSGGSAGGKTTLKLFSASVASGGQETALITTGGNAALSVVITYPNGSQQDLGPKKAGADGHFAYSWVVPGGMAGIVHVVVVSTSVAQATFTIK